MRDEHEGSGANAAAFGDDGRMPRFVPVEELFKGRHFDREIVVLSRGCLLSSKSWASFALGSGWFLGAWMKSQRRLAGKAAVRNRYLPESLLMWAVIASLFLWGKS